MPHLLLLAMTALLLLPASAGASPSWVRFERTLPERITASPSPFTPGATALRFELRDGETAGGDRRAERVEVAGLVDETGNERLLRAGETVYLGWRQRFATDFPSPRPRAGNAWCVFLQIKDIDPLTDRALDGPPTVGLSCDRGRQTIGLGDAWGSHRPWGERLVRGRWQTFVLGLRLSPHSEGAIELWNDGVKRRLRTRAGRLVHRLRGPTLGRRDGAGVQAAYVKFGIYRSARIDGTALASIDDVRLGATYAEAAPRPVGSVGLRQGALLAWDPFERFPPSG